MEKTKWFTHSSRHHSDGKSQHKMYVKSVIWLCEGGSLGPQLETVSDNKKHFISYNELFFNLSSFIQRGFITNCKMTNTNVVGSVSTTSISYKWHGIVICLDVSNHFLNRYHHIFIDVIEIYCSLQHPHVLPLQEYLECAIKFLSWGITCPRKTRLSFHLIASNMIDPFHPVLLANCLGLILTPEGWGNNADAFIPTWHCREIFDTFKMGFLT